MHAHDVPKSHPQVFPHHLIHANLPLLATLVREHDAHRVLSLFALEQHGVPSEQLQLVHLLQVQRHDGVIVVDRLICARRASAQGVSRSLVASNDADFSRRVDKS